MKCQFSNQHLPDNFYSKKASVNKASTLLISFALSAGFYSSCTLADWSNEKLYKGYNQSFGSFPPLDIDQQLADSVEQANNSAISASMTAKIKIKSTSNANNKHTLKPSGKSAQISKQGMPIYQKSGSSHQQFQPSQPNFPQQSYIENQQRWFAYPQYHRNTYRQKFNGNRNNRRTHFSFPWNNRNTQFSMP